MTEPVRRTHYFFGQVLTPEDLQAEQDYHRDMRYRHNRLLGHGVVQGLGVTLGDAGTVVVGAGSAIDTCGRELVLTQDTVVPVTGVSEPDGALDLTAAWAQEPDHFVVPVEEGSDEPAFARWLERPALALLPPDDVPAESVVLGRLLLTAGEATSVDLGNRHTWERADPGAAEATRP